LVTPVKTAFLRTVCRGVGVTTFTVAANGADSCDGRAFAAFLAAFAGFSLEEGSGLAPVCSKSTSESESVRSGDTAGFFRFGVFFAAPACGPAFVKRNQTQHNGRQKGSASGGGSCPPRRRHRSVFSSSAVRSTQKGCGQIVCSTSAADGGYFLLT
jgi:hypothetical protein